MLSVNFVIEIIGSDDEPTVVIRDLRGVPLRVFSDIGKAAGAVVDMYNEMRENSAKSK